VLGSGHFGIVRLGTHNSNDKYIAAIKSIDKSKVKRNLHLLRDEVELLLNIDHPYIIKLYDVYED
jgi:calcium-dependent protein kinase